MADKRMYRSKFWRFLELDKHIRSGSYPNARTFAKEWEVSDRTVRRDIEFMRYSLGAPVEFDQRRNGYYYQDPSWSLPHVYLTEGELVQLLLAERMASQFIGTPLAKSLESLSEKLRALLPDQVSVDPVFLESRVSFHSPPTRPISEEVWISTFRSLRECRGLEFWYQGVHSEEPHIRNTEPLHLCCVANEWYLIGHDSSVDDTRNFALSRIQSIVRVGDVFPEREFDTEEFFSNRFGRFIGRTDEAIKVAIRFSSEVAFFIEEREWHPSQKVKKHRDGSLTLTLEAPSLYEVKRWVLQWGGEAEVLKPKVFREKVAAEIDRMRSVYPQALSS